MRRGVWVVLGLVGMAPVGALAQQPSGQAGTASEAGTRADPSVDDTARPIIVELPATGERRAGEAASGQPAASRPRLPRGSGGSGMSPRPVAPEEGPNAEVFQGTLRAVEGNRLRMADGNGRVYEFGLGDQSRLMGPDGEPVSWQALREGMPVRTVTQPGASENEVVTLQVFELPPAPSR
jgi:hypothetical protein